VSRYSGVAYRPVPWNTAGYVPASGRDARRAQPGTIGLLAYSLEQMRAIADQLGIPRTVVNVRSMGIYNFRNTASGNPSVHGDCRALDLGINVNRDAHRVMVEFLRRIGPNAHRVGLTYAIFSRAQTRNRAWTNYGTRGDRLHDHDDHLHVEQAPTFAAVDSTVMIATCRRVLGDWRPTEEEDMSAAVEGIQRALNTAGFGDPDGNTLTVDGKWGPNTEHAYTTQARAAARHLTSVEGMQKALNDAGHRDADGRRLVVDGWWGDRTQQAWSRSLASGGLSQSQADSRYVRQGHVVQVKL
jgi:hypothetical protein